MMDHDIRQYPDLRQGAEQLGDYWPVAIGLPGVADPLIAVGDEVVDQRSKWKANKEIAKKREKEGGTEETHPSIGYFDNWKEMSPDQQTAYMNNKLEPATGFGGIKMSNIIGELSDPKNKNPRTEKPWIDLDELLGIKLYGSHMGSDQRSDVCTWANQRAAGTTSREDGRGMA